MNASYSHNGKYIQTSSVDDNTARIWDVKTGKLLYTLHEYNSSIIYSMFSYDDRYLVTYSLLDTAAKVWDIHAQEMVHTIVENKGASFLSSIILALSPVDYSLCVGGEGNSATIWDINTGMTKLKMNGHDSQISNIEFSSDGKLIITSSVKGETKIWNSGTGKCLATFSVNGTESLENINRDTAIAMLRNYKLLTNSEGRPEMWHLGRQNKRTNFEPLSGNEDQEIGILYFTKDSSLIVGNAIGLTCLWDPATGRILDSIPNFTIFPIEKGTSSDGSYLLANGGSKDDFFTVDVWNLKTRKKLVSFPAHKDSITSIGFNPANDRILTASLDQSAKVWNLSGELIYTLQGVGTKTTATGVSTGGEYFAFGNEKGAIGICDIKTGTRKYYLGDFRGPVCSVDISFNDSLITTLADNSISVWSYHTGKRLKRIHKDRDSIINCEFSPRATYLLSQNEDYSMDLWDVKTGKLKYKFPKETRKATFTHDDKFIALLNQNQNVVTIISAETGRVHLQKDLSYLGKGGNRTSGVIFDVGGNSFITASDDAIRWWSLKTGEFLDSIKNIRNIKNSTVVQSSSGKNVLLYSWGSLSIDTLDIWELDSKKLQLTIVDSLKLLQEAAFSKDGKYVVTYSEMEQISVYRLSDNKLMYTIKDADGIKGRSTEESFHPLNSEQLEFNSMDRNSDYMIVPSENNKIKIFEGRSGQELYTFVNLDTINYLVQIPSNYYKATSGASRLLHYVTPDLQVISFEQLDIKYNRPDLVLQAIGNTDSNLISSYRKAYEKRTSRLNIDTVSFQNDQISTECDIVNKDIIDFDQRQKKILLHIKAKDSVNKIDHFNIWINAVPMFGINGVGLRDANLNEFDTTLTVTLSEGLNTIETSITNVSGVESYRVPMQVNYKSTHPKKSKTWFIGIGIDQFKDKTHNLAWSVADIKGLAKSFKQNLDQEIEINTLFNNQVTINNIKSLKSKLLNTSEDDKVIVAYSGHGILSNDFDYYLSTWSVDFDHPELQGLPYSVIEDLLDGIPSRKKLMLLDACHSGEVDKEELKRYEQVKSKLKGIKGTILNNKDTIRIGIKNSFELMQEIFLNVRRSTGATIISAAAGTQFAFEKNDLKAGVFTFAILEYMKSHKSSTVSEMKKYVNKRVGDLTEGLQQPTARSENINYDWKIW